jgi:predicted flap endonuclease-1-like 5' DNA nuclease
MISGVGPKIEGILHSLGIYTYKQVASWKKAEREWVDKPWRAATGMAPRRWSARAATGSSTR